MNTPRKLVHLTIMTQRCRSFHLTVFTYTMGLPLAPINLSHPLGLSRGCRPVQPYPIPMDRCTQ